MFLELKKLFFGESGREEFSGVLDWSTVTYSGCSPFSASVRVSGTVSNTSGIVRLVYHAETKLKMPCDRCAAETEKDFSKAFEHVLVTSLNGEDTGEFLVVEPGFRLNMDELVLADMLLEFPSKYLCQEDCKGICPGCGVNLNTEKCRCGAKPVDPRLEILKNLIS
ncbi:MAG: YceD family protein [Acutalibacteraceae bacterium]|jgi:uncharacterized protein